jgi:hypothetical protein
MTHVIAGGEWRTRGDLPHTTAKSTRSTRHRDAATAICALTEPAMTGMKGTMLFR